MVASRAGPGDAHGAARAGHLRLAPVQQAGALRRVVDEATEARRVRGHAERGARELARASRYQRRARGRMCMFGVLLIIVIVALILVLKFALKMI